MARLANLRHDIPIAFVAFVIATLAFLVAPRTASALDPARIAPGESTVDIAPAVEVFADPTGSLDERSVAALGANGFVHASGPHPNYGFTRSTLWFRFALENDSSRTRDLILDAGREWLDDVDLFAVDSVATRHLAHSGSFVALRSRPVATERIALPIALGPHERATFLVRMRGASPMAFEAAVWDATAYHQHEAVEEALFGGYYGLLFAFALYSFLLFAALRDRTQLIAGLLLVSWTLGEACAHGHVARFFPFAAGQIELRGPAFFFSITAGTALAWLRTLIPFARGSRRDRLDRIGRASIVGLTALPTIVPRAFAVTYVGLSIFAAVIIFESIRAVRGGHRSARFFALAVGAWTTCGIGPLGVFFGLLPAYSAVEYGAHIGAITMASLFSLLLVDAIRSDRERIVTLNTETRSLNTALESQLAKVESNAKSIDALNAELSYQVAARSRELVDLLARQETLTVGRVLESGEVFEGRYRVTKTLGAGAWGVVYEVERTTDARRLALKLVTRASSGSEAARVAREAEIGARVRHPNLVAIVDVGVSGTCPFVVMELVTGGSLEGRRDSFGDASWALPVLGDVARGISALHAAQIVHRDVKPANILVEEREGRLVARVADFGIARPEERDVDPLGATMGPEALRRSPKLTQAEALVGTPLYMPPEAAKTGSVGTAGDVFAFGVVAYEMIDGNAPYAGATVFLALAGEELPAPRPLVAKGIDDRVRRCVERCVSADPSARPTMREVEDVLAASATT